MRYRLPVLLLTFLISPATGADYPARIVGVSGGDTLTVLRDGRTQVRIRLFGAEAPEASQDFGTRAKQAASELAFGKTVTIRERDRDRYGRTVAEVILPDGTSLNREMIARGMAWHYRQFAPNDRTLATLEAQARAARRGLWAHPKPVPPWEWRKTGGMPPAAPGTVVCNRNSRVYHNPTCAGARRMAERNRVEFQSSGDAVRAGYRKAGDCRPG